MEKKVIFFDADGTIINGDHMSSRVKETLEQLRNDGHILVLSTGRNIPMLGDALKDMAFENIISSAGNVTMAENEIIFNQALPTEDLKEICAYLDERNIDYHMGAQDYVWVKKGRKQDYLNRHISLLPDQSAVTEEQYEAALKNLEDVSKRTREAENLADIAVNKIHYFSEELPFKQVKETFGERYQCVPLSLSKQFSGGEISVKGVTKKVGMEKILEHFDMPLESAIAVGDDFNDIEMLEYAPYSVVLGHAHEDVKKFADHATEDIENDGFYHAMVHVGLI